MRGIGMSWGCHDRVGVATGSATPQQLTSRANLIQFQFKFKFQFQTNSTSNPNATNPPTAQAVHFHTLLTADTPSN